MIVKQGNKFVLKSKGSGKVLGRHDTRAEAQRQEAAIQAGKAKEKKK